MKQELIDSKTSSPEAFFPMTHPYELDHAPASFLRGCWTAYRGRPAVNVNPFARVEYQRGYAAGTADRAEIERRWKRWASAAVFLFALCFLTTAQAQTTTVTRDAFGRATFTTTRTRDSVVIRDRFGREVLTTTRRPNR